MQLAVLSRHRPRSSPKAAVLFITLAAITSCRKTGPPFSPEESLSKLQVADGFRVELAAAEPQVLDPIAAAFDERGRMYVVEMSDYPNSNQPKGQIRMLEDRDGDGRYEHMTVFAKELHFPHGVLPWKGGVIVTSAPDILYLKDTDGDGRLTYDRF